MVTLIDKARRAKLATGALYVAYDERCREASELRAAYERGMRAGHANAWEWGVICGVALTLAVGIAASIIYAELAPYL